MNADLRHQVLELKFAKRYGEAVDLVRRAAEDGDVAARVMLARMWEAAGLSRAEADEHVEFAHRHLEPVDIIGHLELYGAYADGLGGIDYDLKARRSFEHLLVAAERDAGHTYSLAVARAYRTGGLAVPVDIAKAAWWYRKAAAQGSPDAPRELESLDR
ncbi:hypothetical protein OU995_08355 [Roseateles sp. SL47]|uniref:hypothetical protein n=1 Tax=Roseateles sp. SL47 TaxID=2995138 RepID=UPI00226E1CC6|nr:hypothetical protein [Roseateles sp. SL47]WAC74697.1 hypothetical protein OU995_08355 [Roseateles sp. SL47]